MSSVRNLLFAELPFLPAELQYHKNSNGYVVVFYVRNPSTRLMEKYRVKLNRLRRKYSTLMEFKSAAKRICDDYNAKLQGGWTPFGESMNVRQFEPLVPVLERFLSEKSNELTKDTMRSYKSLVRILASWLDKLCPHCSCENFNRQLAVRFMEERWREGISSRTYNNNIKVYRTMFVWLIEHCYCKENAFATIKPKAVLQKKRVFIPVDTLLHIFSYVRDNHKDFYIVMLMIYYSGLRPAEVTRIKVHQLDFASGSILLDPSQTKNHKEGIANMSEELVQLLREHVSGAKPTDYVFGGRDYSPKAKPMTSNSFGKRWNSIRQELHLPEEYQLYSLRDSSGVHRFNNGASALDIMKSLRHSNLAQTSVYTNHYDEGLHERLERVTPHIALA